MAREFILFVHICHRFGGKTAVPFKTSSGWPTVCHRGKMKTPGEWEAGVVPREAAQIYPALLTFLPEHKHLSSLDSTFQKGTPNPSTRFLQILNMFKGSSAYPRQICLPTQEWDRKWKVKLWQPHSHPFVNYNGAWQRG